MSDVYQDLFDEGIFTGKGLYDVDAFVASLEDRVPENALLSHDLFEGLYARTALVTDVEVVDDYPSSVLAHAQAPAPLGARRLADPLVAASRSCRRATGWQRNRLPLISRWKILDNLRRSLMAPAIVALLLAGLDRAAGLAARLDGRRPRRRARCRCAATGRCSAGRHALAVGRAASRARGCPDRRRPRRAAADVPRRATPTSVLHAIGVTLVRLGVTRERLLEWETAAAAAAPQPAASASARSPRA